MTFSKQEQIAFKLMGIKPLCRNCEFWELTYKKTFGRCTMRKESFTREDDTCYLFSPRLEEKSVP